MKELTDLQKERLTEIQQNVGKILIATMNHLEIPNFIESTYLCDGNMYKLKFEKVDYLNVSKKTEAKRGK